MDYQKVEVSPAVYLKIIKSLRDIGEVDLSLAACRQGLKKFSQDVGLYNIQGELHLLKFNKCKDSEELKSALRSFEKALTIDPLNYLASIYSGKIYMRAGVLNKAHERVDSIIKTAPFDVEAQRLKRELKRKEAQRNKEIFEKLKKQTVPDSKELDVNVDEHIDYKVMTDSLSIFTRLKGLQAYFLIDQYGTTIKKQNNSEVEEKLLSAVVMNIFRSSQSGLSKIGIGNLHTGMLMVSFGNFYIINVSGAIVLLLTSSDTNQKEVDEAIKDYFEAI